MPLQTESFGSGNLIWNVINVILVLGVILVLIVLVIRFLGRRNQMLMSARSIRTIGATGLGPNKSLQIVEIGNKLYLIGVGDDVTLVDKISDPMEVALVLSAFEDQSAGNGSGIRALVAGLKSKFRGEVPSQEIDLNETSSFYEVLQSKLQPSPERKERIEELLREESAGNRREEP
ncbi:flagellar biosynthetic protein FliO [Paenibacillus glufosinatiresistens]|uniref:flagellar biosynthetic protein FliO n=1 Tax=Paenibacillus glufosinatiresistens TaxID=3070657 RepID=UPI00286EACCE|nr:flagellar biosynthetic protein FliO [Paenibacillus sp. YX.27]